MAEPKFTAWSDFQLFHRPQGSDPSMDTGDSGRDSTQESSLYISKGERERSKGTLLGTQALSMSTAWKGQIHCLHEALPAQEATL